MQEIKQYVATKKAQLKDYIKQTGFSKKLVIIWVGENKASERYVRNKVKDAEELGISAITLHYGQDITESELLENIKLLNKDDSVGGYIVQLPLPDHIDVKKIMLAVDPKKDIDGFHPLNTKVFPATPAGILNYLESQNFIFEGKNAVILGRSDIVGKPMQKLLLEKDMNVVNLHSHTTDKDRMYYLSHADLIICAVGKQNIITVHNKLKASAVIMDVGINVGVDGKLHGDCQPNLPVRFQSPVPGGCGLLTRLTLMENLLKLNE